jgi:peptidoglycan/xylan/chitin deacetylase (PgdA/CDA1 family)
MAVRRFFASRKRRQHKATWPIDPSTTTPPSSWSGWPDKKRFAFLLSHDVETQIGYDKISDLVDLEESLGFRSVINFIPEGQYRVNENLVQNLKDRGFEVGVHGLHHDGKLYNNFDIFKKRAQKINHYLKAWDATGFRSPFMHRNLDWLHLLNVSYDSSTFDTDPFEPQFDGLGTIFPKWIPIPNGEQSPESGEQKSEARERISDSRHQSSDLDGYFELPYTLPQDSTLYLLLKEQTIDIWKTKTAWLAKHGGMAFLNVHPDYMDFSGKGTQSQYPVSHYADFLKHIKETYTDQYWHANPNEVAQFFINRKERPQSL